MNPISTLSLSTLALSGLVMVVFLVEREKVGESDSSQHEHFVLINVSRVWNLEQSTQTTKAQLNFMSSYLSSFHK
jgi:hypothetical protein